MSIRLTLPYPPSTNEYWQPRIVRGRPSIGPTALAEAYKSAVEKLVKPAIEAQLSGDLCLTVAVYRPRNAGDISNRLKVLEDALNAVAWEDDRQVARIEIERWRSEDDVGRVDVWIEAHVPRPPPARPELPASYLQRLQLAIARMEAARDARKRKRKAKEKAREVRRTRLDAKGLRALATPATYRRWR